VWPSQSRADGPASSRQSAPGNRTDYEVPSAKRSIVLCKKGAFVWRTRGSSEIASDPTAHRGPDRLVPGLTSPVPAPRIPVRSHPSSHLYFRSTPFNDGQESSRQPPSLQLPSADLLCLALHSLLASCPPLRPLSPLHFTSPAQLFAQVDRCPALSRAFSFDSLHRRSPT